MIDAPENTLCQSVTSLETVWTCQPASALSEGSNPLQFIAIDDAANKSAPTAHRVTIDSLAPSAPVIVAPPEGVTIATNKPQIVGTAEAQSRVMVMNEQMYHFVAQLLTPQAIGAVFLFPYCPKGSTKFMYRPKMPQATRDQSRNATLRLIQLLHQLSLS